MFQENVLLSQHSNYKIGGPARYFVLAHSVEEITDSVALAKVKKLPILVLGGGTNILFSDAGFDGLVIKPYLKTIKRDGNLVRVGAGATVAELLDFTVANKLSGLEWAGGLPGSVGGAIWGNAGAFGGETKDRLIDVTSLDISGDMPVVHIRKNKEVSFGYRSSIFKEQQAAPAGASLAQSTGREIILSATFELKEGEPTDIQKIIDEKKQYRTSRQPLEYPNIGSIFKNVDVKKVPKEVVEQFKHKIKLDPFPVLPTAVLNDAAGLKGLRVGGAMVSPKHPNFIVNVDNATEKDVKAVIELVMKEIHLRYGIELEREVIFW